MPQYGYGGHSGNGNIHIGTFQSSKAYRSRLPGESVLDNDGDSDRAILDEEHVKGLGITKTTQASVRETEAESSKGGESAHKRSEDWPEPERTLHGSHAV
jgi:hypothetical protein